MCRSWRKSFLFKKCWCHIINDVLTGLLGPYKKYEPLTFTHGPSLTKKIGFVFPSTDGVTR